MKNYLMIVEYTFFLLQKVVSYLLNNKMTYTNYSIYYSQVSIWFKNSKMNEVTKERHTFIH